jgi:hypothetical protein
MNLIEVDCKYMKWVYEARAGFCNHGDSSVDENIKTGNCFTSQLLKKDPAPWSFLFQYWHSVLTRHLFLTAVVGAPDCPGTGRPHQVG